MSTLITGGLIVLTTALLIPVLVLFVEVLAAVVTRSRLWPITDYNNSRGTVAVLVPAHNEGEGVRATLHDIQPQLRTGDRLVVVADNCTDDTVTVARATGAEVIERSESGRRGKGYALEFGIRYLKNNPPQCLIVIDADCRVPMPTIDVLASVCGKTRRPVQALDLMISPEGSEVNYKVAEFAWRIKNWVRPAGLKALNLPCHLMGTGMAFPWSLLNSVDFATDNIVEDLEIGLKLAAVGKPPFFSPSARVISVFPPSATGGAAQKSRWEQGHLGMIARAVPVYLCRAAKTGNLALLALAIDLAVPPLSLLALLIAGIMTLSLAAVAAGFGSTPAILAGAATLLFATTITFAWKAFGTDLLSLPDLRKLIGYTLGKTAFYLRVLRRRTSAEWNRAERDKRSP